MLTLMLGFRGIHKRTCPICQYNGYFRASGTPLRFDAFCRGCGSLERHRQHFLLFKDNPSWIDGTQVLHFAPEQCFVSDYKARSARYVQADLIAGPGEAKVDIQNISFDNDTFDTIICHQIMEHVADDLQAVKELYRVVKPGGIAVLSVPIIYSWDTTYKNSNVSSAAERDLQFGQHDHVRYYGRDFERLLTSVGFRVSENIAREPNVSRYGLIRGGIIYVATKAP